MNIMRLRTFACIIFRRKGGGKDLPFLVHMLEDFIWILTKMMLLRHTEENCALRKNTVVS